MAPKMLRWLRASRHNKENVLPESTGPASPPKDSSGSGSAFDVLPPNLSIPKGISTADREASRLQPSDHGYRGTSPSPDRNRQSLGLHVIHRPSLPAPVDIIFVHGLGGDSQKTWSKNHDPKMFWPGLWLPNEPDVGKARILTFGYNANFRPGSSKSIANVSDFAKELLYEMSFGKDNDGHDFAIGKMPIIFVVHSMGGLVVKKAYILGQNDEEYQSIISSISAIVFLATPHRGTQLAETLNRILRVSFQSPKYFITELNKGSPALEELNEQFRHIAPKLSIFSFYETLPTPVLGLKKLMVLEKDSSILGYPKEVSRDLVADHHHVCKYSSTSDPNYIIVRNALQTLVGRFQSKGLSVRANQILGDCKDIEKLLGISTGPEDDLNLLLRRWTPGTCEWITQEPVLKSWLEEPKVSKAIWFNAPPASGKSVLSAYLVKYLQGEGYLCQYFFFKFGDQSKRSLGNLLRSFAYQIARDAPSLRRLLIDVSTEGLKLEKADFTLVWQRIFEAIIFKMQFAGPLYWIIDAVDESESPKALLDLFASISRSKTPICVLLISRKTESLTLAVNRLTGFVPVDIVEKYQQNHNSTDIEKLVAAEMKHMRGTDDLKRNVTQSILTRASANFLWVRLVLEEILNCHTEEAIEETLDEIPSDMNDLYQRMELAILNNPRKSNKHLAKTLLEWTICANRSLTTKELSQALKPEFRSFIDLKRTIHEVCGQFVLVDQKEQVAMVHKTARDYLIQSSSSELAIDLSKAHGQLFIKSLSVLLDPKLRSKLTNYQLSFRDVEPFLVYAATSWEYHLKMAGSALDKYLDMLVNFFSSDAVLSWIYVLALIDKLEVLVKAAKAIGAFVGLHRKLNDSRNPLLHRLSDLEILDLWMVDLVKVVGKFSKHLLFQPIAIYKLVPPFCPERSILRRQFYHLQSAEVIVSGVSDTDWNDNLAKMTLPNAEQAWKIVCAGSCVAVSSSAGNIFIYDSSTFSQLCTLSHQEPITALSANSKGTNLVSYGLRSTKLWSIPSGQLLQSWSNLPDSKSMTIIFADNDSKILTGGDDKVIRFINLDDIEIGWRVLDPTLLKEATEVDGSLVSTPMWMAFNADATQVGVSYRGFPLSVWNLTEFRCIGRCSRATSFQNENPRPSMSWFAVDRFTWNPVSGHVIGVYKNGCLFKWHPVTDENQEIQAQADEVAASSDGKLFVTSNSNGTVKVWNFAYFSVIYQLSSADLVTGLAFSPGSQRFYDLRGCTVNAWESNSLIRFSETEESFGDFASEDQSPTSVSHISEAYVGEFKAVTSLAVDPKSRLYCVGNEDGNVNLCDLQTGKHIEFTKFLNFLSVNHLIWSEDGLSVAAADLGGDIILKHLSIVPSINSTRTIELTTLESPKINLEGRAIHQMLFNHDSSLLLIVMDDWAQVWDINHAKATTGIDVERGATRQWSRHPFDHSLFLAFGRHDVKLFQWDNFLDRGLLQYREGMPRMYSEGSFNKENEQLLDSERQLLWPASGQITSSTAKKVIFTQDLKHTLLQTSDTSSQGQISKSVLIFENEVFYQSDHPDPHVLTYHHIPPSMHSKIDVPLGMISEYRLVFLDPDLWVCTYKLDSASREEATKRHYFIPRDWESTESLEQCCMIQDGTLLFPKNDTVAVVGYNLDGLRSRRIL